MDGISGRLRRAREHAGYSSAAEAAHQLGIPYGTYSGHENGHRGITRKKVVEYAQKFHVSAEWLLTGVGVAEETTTPLVQVNEMSAQSVRSKAGKRAVNVSIRADLIKEAKAFGTNISAVVERALEEEHRARRREKWRQENRPAIEAWNRWVEENGIPFEELKPW